MQDLIKALQIFAKYTNTVSPTYCMNAMFCVDVDFNSVSKEDVEELNRLGFFFFLTLTGKRIFGSWRFGCQEQ